jgi:hypothetical protein
MPERSGNEAHELVGRTVFFSYRGGSSYLTSARVYKLQWPASPREQRFLEPRTPAQDLELAPDELVHGFIDELPLLA